MKSVGWEIRPIGWIVLVVVAVLVIIFTIKWLRRLSQKGDGKA